MCSLLTHTQWPFSRYMWVSESRFNLHNQGRFLILRVVFEERLLFQHERNCSHLQNIAQRRFQFQRFPQFCKPHPCTSQSIWIESTCSTKTAIMADTESDSICQLTHQAKLHRRLLHCGRVEQAWHQTQAASQAQLSDQTCSALLQPAGNQNSSQLITMKTVKL